MILFTNIQWIMWDVRTQQIRYSAIISNPDTGQILNKCDAVPVSALDSALTLNNAIFDACEVAFENAYGVNVGALDKRLFAGTIFAGL